MPDFLRLAFGALTAIPVPPPRRIDRSVARWAMAAAPLALVPLAAVVTGLLWAARELGWPPMLVGAMVVALLALSNRGMHLDGLADTADGLSVAFDREKALRVMKQGDVGPSGAGAIVLVSLIDAAAIAALLQVRWGWIAAGCSVLASRHALAWACTPPFPAARPDGLGQALAGSVPVPLAAAGWGLLTALGTGLVMLAGGPWWAMLVAMAALLLVTLATVLRARARLGGVTGDVLGFVIEAGLTAMLLVLAL